MVIFGWVKIELEKFDTHETIIMSDLQINMGSLTEVDQWSTEVAAEWFIKVEVEQHGQK